MNPKNSTPPEHILRMAEVNRVSGVGRSGSYAKMDPNSPQYDPTWPIPVRLSARAIGWRESEILEWLRQRPRVRVADQKE